MEYLRYFESESAYTESRNNDYVEPWVSLTEDENLQEGRVNYNMTEEERLLSTPLTIKSLGSGTISLRNKTGTLQYRKNGGDWQDVDGGIQVASGDEVSFKDTNYTSYSSDRITASTQYNVFGNIMSLVDANNFASLKTIPLNNCFYNLFSNTPVVSAQYLKLPATTLSQGCYYFMFHKCASLVTAPELPATALTSNCYDYMFAECTSLTTAPELPATTLAYNCYHYMFYGCNSLVNAPQLPATTLSQGCYSDMFRDCTSLTTAPELPATTLASSCYSEMFSGCTSLVSAPTSIIANAISASACTRMFENCINLTTAPQLSAETRFNEYCFNYMFKGCTSLVNVPDIHAIRVDSAGCFHMFEGCTSLVTPPDLLINLAYGGLCYSYMFSGCTSLTTSPEIHLESLPNSCCAYMFVGCTSLTTAPELTAERSTGNACYQYMFSGCTALTTPPDVIYISSTSACTGMFNGCTSLATAPKLPATNLNSNCYTSMFAGCTSLTTAPELPATDLGSYCYSSMFRGCTSLTKAPVLPASYLTTKCYAYMFNGCTNLNYVECYATNPSTGFSENWLSGTSVTGTFMMEHGVTWDRSISGIPTGWNLVDLYDTLLTFEVVCGGTLTWNYYRNTGVSNTGTTLEIMMNNSGTWTNLTPNSSLNVSSGDIIQFYCYKGPWNLSDAHSFAGASLEWYHYFSTGNGCQFKVYGNIMSILSEGTQTQDTFNYNPGWGGYYLPIGDGDDEYCSVNHLAYLFANCTGLISIKNLIMPATIIRGVDGISEGCYYGMFSGCTSLVDFPKYWLPATTLADNCYKGMFSNCISISSSIEMIDATLDNYCCQDMFAGCTGITSADLYASTLVQGCYNGMFSGCTSLSYIHCSAQNPDASYTQNWVYGVADYGQFDAIGTCEYWSEGVNGIPINWDVNCGEG